MLLFVLTVVLGCVQSNTEWHFTGDNVARNKYTNQFPEGPAASHRAVDGNTETIYADGTCTHTAAIYRAPAYWSVDLNGAYIIKGIRIYNRDQLRAHCMIANGGTQEGGQTTDKQSTVVPAAAGGGVAAAIGVLAVIGVVVFFLIRRRNNRKDHPETAEAYNSPVRQRDLEAVTEDIMYAVCPEEKVTEGCYIENPGTYYNVGDNPKQPKRAINVTDLADVVFSPDSIFRFSKEFNTFPGGMKQPHQQAIKNRRLNRYKNLFAYDESRVILDIWNVNSDTDYINACYIHGFRKPKAFIASQGPTVDNVNDFWRMMWQTNSDTIVMLTNLFEDDKMKCICYWPEETDVYGEIEVELASIETFSNFVIRTLLVTKTGEPQRRVQQFHFTTWPDKDVPYFSSSLVHFRNKVNAVDSVCGGPVVVHCSAGVGRTGTFIAIDFLTDQANALGYIDVAGCVDELRRQRVDMVQKEMMMNLSKQSCESRNTLNHPISNTAPLRINKVLTRQRHEQSRTHTDLNPADIL